MMQAHSFSSLLPIPNWPSSLEPLRFYSWVSVFSSVVLSFFFVLSCSCWLSLIGFDLGFFLL